MGKKEETIINLLGSKIAQVEVEKAMLQAEVHMLQLEIQMLKSIEAPNPPTQMPGKKETN